MSESPSYHDLHITTKDIERTSLSDLPHGYEVSCNRVSGWCLWKRSVLVAGEYDAPRWLVLDVAGHVIVDSRPEEDR